MEVCEQRSGASGIALQLDDRPLRLLDPLQRARPRRRQGHDERSVEPLKRLQSGDVEPIGPAKALVGLARRARRLLLNGNWPW